MGDQSQWGGIIGNKFTILFESQDIFVEFILKRSAETKNNKARYGLK